MLMGRFWKGWIERGWIRWRGLVMGSCALRFRSECEHKDRIEMLGICPTRISRGNLLQTI